MKKFKAVPTTDRISHWYTDVQNPHGRIVATLEITDGLKSAVGRPLILELTAEEAIDFGERLIRGAEELNETLVQFKKEIAADPRFATDSSRGNEI